MKGEAGLVSYAEIVAQNAKTMWNQIILTKSKSPLEEGTKLLINQENRLVGTCRDYHHKAGIGFQALCTVVLVS